MTESPEERRQRELREKAARAAEMPNAEIVDLQPPIVIRDYCELMDGGSRRYLLRDMNSRTASVEWNYAINGKHHGQTIAFHPLEKTWTPISSEVLCRVQKWIGEAILRGDFPVEYADQVTDYAKYAKY